MTQTTQSSQLRAGHFRCRVSLCTTANQDHNDAGKVALLNLMRVQGDGLAPSMLFGMMLAQFGSHEQQMAGTRCYEPLVITALC